MKIEHITALDAHRVKIEDRVDMLAAVRTPEEAFNIKYDYCVKLRDKLNELHNIILKITEINGVESSKLGLVQEIPELQNLHTFTPVLPYSAEPNEFTVPAGKQQQLKIKVNRL